VEPLPVPVFNRPKCRLTSSDPYCGQEDHPQHAIADRSLRRVLERRGVDWPADKPLYDEQANYLPRSSNPTVEACPVCGLTFKDGKPAEGAGKARRQFSTFGHPVVTLEQHLADHRAEVVSDPCIRNPFPALASSVSKLAEIDKTLTTRSMYDGSGTSALGFVSGDDFDYEAEGDFRISVDGVARRMRIADYGFDPHDYGLKAAPQRTSILFEDIDHAFSDDVAAALKRQAARAEVDEDHFWHVQLVRTTPEKGKHGKPSSTVPSESDLSRHIRHYGSEGVETVRRAYAGLTARLPRRRRLTDDLRVQVVELQQKGLVTAAIADELGLSDRQVKEAARAA
jgi:hypothetical protein